MRAWLSDIRKTKGLNQYKAAGLAGMSQSYYAAIETGQRGKPLPVNTAKKIAAALGFDWTMFFEDSTSEPTPGGQAGQKGESQ